MEQLKSRPINDFMTKEGHIQPDGSLVRDMYLFEVKKPSESNSEWDLLQAGRHDCRGCRVPAATLARWSRAEQRKDRDRLIEAMGATR
jgi:hypothetical protein